jgi:hypothetical protein
VAEHSVRNGVVTAALLMVEAAGTLALTVVLSVSVVWAARRVFAH